MCRQFYDSHGLPIIVLRPDCIMDCALGIGRFKEQMPGPYLLRATLCIGYIIKKMLSSMATTTLIQFNLSPWMQSALQNLIEKCWHFPTTSVVCAATLERTAGWIGMILPTR